MRIPAEELVVQRSGAEDADRVRREEHKRDVCGGLAAVEFPSGDLRSPLSGPWGSGARRMLDKPRLRTVKVPPGTGADHVNHAKAINATNYKQSISSTFVCKG
jgi:hypothetical protein